MGALEEKARFRARIEELGEQQVRLLMSTGGLPMQSVGLSLIAVETALPPVVRHLGAPITWSSRQARGSLNCGRGKRHRERAPDLGFFVTYGRLMQA